MKPGDCTVLLLQAQLHAPCSICSSKECSVKVDVSLRHPATLKHTQVLNRLTPKSVYNIYIILQDQRHPKGVRVRHSDIEPVHRRPSRVLRQTFKYLTHVSHPQMSTKGLSQTFRHWTSFRRSPVLHVLQTWSERLSEVTCFLGGLLTFKRSVHPNYKKI